LQFLQELLRRFDVLLSILLLRLIVGCSLIVCLVGLIGLIVGLRVIGGVGGIVRRFFLGIFAFDNDGIGAWRGSHGRHRAGKHGLVAGSSLLHRRSWSAVGCTARLCHQDHSIQCGRIGRRPQKKIIEVRTIEQRCQDIPRWSRAKMSNHAFRRGAGELYRCTRLRPNRL